MDLKQLKLFLEEVLKNKAKCDGCPLKNSGQQLIFEPDREVNIMVITQGPNRLENPDFIASPANHPTYNYLNSLFSGKFRPLKDSTAYWTHLRKCFLRDREGNVLTTAKEDKILEICKNAYLSDEIRIVQPKFILAVGTGAVRFLCEVSDCNQLMIENKKEKTTFEKIFKKQKDGLFENVRICGITSTVAVVPHPSARNRFWNNPPEGTKEILRRIQEAISRVINSD